MTALLHILRRFGWVILLVIGTALVIQSSRRTNQEWTTVYVVAGQRLLEGKELYYERTPFTYPPFTAALAIPFGYLPVKVANATFQAINFLALIVMVRLAWRLSGGGSFPEFFSDSLSPRERAGVRGDARRDVGSGTNVEFSSGPHPNPLPGGEGIRRGGREEIWIALLGALAGIRFSFNAMSHLQTDVIIACLIMLGAVALTRGKSVIAGAWWGLAAAFKATPLLLVGYLVWRKRFAGAGILLATFLAASSLPELIHRPESGTWTVAWVKQFVAPMTKSDAEVGKWYASMLDNQSIVGGVKRALTTDFRFRGNNEMDVNLRENAPGPGVMKAVTYGLYGMLILACAWVMWPALSTLKNHPQSTAIIGTEVAIVLCAMLLLSPMSSRAHFCTLLLPGFIGARLAILGKDELAKKLLVLAIFLGWIVNNNDFTMVFARIGFWLGFVTLATICLMILAMRMRRRLQTADIMSDGPIMSADKMGPSLIMSAPIRWGRLMALTGVSIAIVLIGVWWRYREFLK